MKVCALNMNPSRPFVDHSLKMTHINPLISNSFRYSTLIISFLPINDDFQQSVFFKLSKIAQK